VNQYSLGVQSCPWVHFVWPDPTQPKYTSGWLGSRVVSFLDSNRSLQVTWVINPAVGCHYFSRGPQLPPKPLRGLLPVLLLGEQGHKTVIRQRRDCYLNTCPSAPESSKLTTRLRNPTLGNRVWATFTYRLGGVCPGGHLSRGQMSGGRMSVHVATQRLRGGTGLSH